MQQKNCFWKNKKKKDYWNKYEDYHVKLSSNELDCNTINVDLLIFDDKKVIGIKDGREEENIHQDLGDEKGKVLLDDNKRILKSIWKKDTSDYSWGVKKYDLLAMKNREIKHKK